MGRSCDVASGTRVSVDTAVNVLRMCEQAGQVHSQREPEIQIHVAFLVNLKTKLQIKRIPVINSVSEKSYVFL